MQLRSNEFEIIKLIDKLTENDSSIHIEMVLAIKEINSEETCLLSKNEVEACSTELQACHAPVARGVLLLTSQKISGSIFVSPAIDGYLYVA